MSSSIATVVQSVSMKQSAINAVQQLLVENVAPMSTVTTTDLPSETGNKEKKPRAPKKDKPTVDTVDGAVAVAVVDNAKPEKKPRAPKKVKPTVDNVVEPVVAVDNVVEPVDSSKPEKKPRAPKKDKPKVDSKIDNDTTVILQFIEKMSETLVIDKDTYNKLHQSLFPDKSPTAIESTEQQIPETNVVVKTVVSSDKLSSDVELEEGEEFEEELVTTEFVHKGVLYLKDAEDNLYSRIPPHEFVLNLLE